MGRQPTRRTRADEDVMGPSGRGLRNALLEKIAKTPSALRGRDGARLRVSARAERSASARPSSWPSPASSSGRGPGRNDARRGGRRHELRQAAGLVRSSSSSISRYSRAVRCSTPQFASSIRRRCSGIATRAEPSATAVSGMAATKPAIPPLSIPGRSERAAPGRACPRGPAGSGLAAVGVMWPQPWSALAVCGRRTARRALRIRSPARRCLRCAVARWTPCS